NNEIGQLARTINNLSGNVLSKISSLSLERAQLKSMLACMKEGIISLSDSGDILFCNRAAYFHLDLNPSGDMRGRNISDIDGFEPLTKIWRKAIQTKELTFEEITYKRNKDAKGERKFLKIYATFYQSLIENKNMTGDSGVMIVIDNHTEIKKLQNIRKDFIAHVSHELKTPLTSISGYVETLLAKDTLQDLDTSRRFLAKINSNTSRLLSLVMDLLSLTKVESSSISVEQRPVQWLPVIRSVTETCEHKMNKKHIHLEVKKQYGGLLVLGEQESMYTILENLLSNAIRYSKESSTIRICFSKTKSHLQIHIIDSGVGISEEHLPFIFEKFYRVDKARSREEGGTGLGLSIVKLLTDKLGGTLSVESKVGLGSTFSVSLPRAF
ncbi:MAG: ATP-binding protein, partial [Proteobacteria bacterium]|nr:ATP-binding protein [Pseudomonadota bacterium]